MSNLLLLVHRIPYPPNKGDKIRSWHLLQYLAQRYRVHLATFVDDPDDWQFIDEVRSQCADSCFIGLDPRRARLRSLSGFFSGQALTLPYYSSAGLADWVRGKFNSGHIDRVVVFSSSMVQYAEPFMERGVRCVVDFVDIDSDKWRQYAEGLRYPMKWVYGRESARLLAYEQRVAAQADASVFVSPAEADLFRSLAPRARHVDYYCNGVDTGFFSPDAEVSSPYAADEIPLVFTGAMDYWANVDSVTWFAREVFPQVHRELPQARFYIVGARPVEEVTRLAQQPGIHVTGTVPDIRPYIRHARLSVAPLRIARGIQNKVLEAMAMGCPVLASPAACEGIEAEIGVELLQADSVPQWREAVLRCVDDADLRGELADRGRRRVLDAYTWPPNLDRLGHLLEPVAEPMDGAA